MVMLAAALKYPRRNDLIRWMQEKKVFATHEVIEWGSINYYNRAAQTKGDLVREGRVQRLTDEEKYQLGYRCKDEVYRWIG